MEEDFDQEYREQLGVVVRLAWLEWAKKQPNPKPSWLLSWKNLPEADKEADRQIGEAVARFVLTEYDEDLNILCSKCKNEDHTDHDFDKGGFCEGLTDLPEREDEIVERCYCPWRPNYEEEE